MTGAGKTTIDELRKHAENGDADAQYALAGYLSNAGAREEADRWLKASADGGCADALYTMATRLFKSIEQAGDAADLLKRSAQAGSVSARRLLSVLYAQGVGVAPDWKEAVTPVIAAAKDKDAAAMREIAMLLFAADPNDPDGAALIAASAGRDAAAAVVAVRRAASGRNYADMSFASETLKKLSAANYPNAPALSKALKATPATEPKLAPTPDWARIGLKLTKEPATPSASPEMVSAEPSVRVFRGVFSPEECEYVIASSARLLAPSLIVDPQTGQSHQDDYRSSLTAVLTPVDLDLALVMINKRIAAIAERPAESGEFLGVLCYRPGQEYRPHFDWLPNGAELARSGQRVATALLYLNDDYEGGETHFLTPDIRFKGGLGDLLVFENVDAAGAPDQLSRHAGAPVAKGVKWLGSRWFREKKYNY